MRNSKISLLLVVLANCQLGLGNRALKQLQQLNNHRFNLINDRNWRRPLHWNSIWDLHNPNYNHHWNSASNIIRNSHLNFPRSWPYHRIKNTEYYGNNGDRNYHVTWSHLSNRGADNYNADNLQRYVESRSQERTEDSKINERNIEDPDDGVWTHMEIRNGPEDESRKSRVMISTSWRGKGEDGKEEEPRGKVVRVVWTDGEPKELATKDNQVEQRNTVKLIPQKESRITDQQREEDETKDGVILKPSQSKRDYAKEESEGIENVENVNITKDHLKEKDPSINPVENQEESSSIKEEIKNPVEVPLLETKIDENISKDSEAIKKIEDDKEKVIETPMIRELEESKNEDTTNLDKVEDNDANNSVIWSQTVTRQNDGESKVTVTRNIIRDSKQNRSNVVRMVWNSMDKKDVNEADTIKPEDLKMSDSLPKRRASAMLDDIKARRNLTANGILESGIWINGVRVEDLNSIEEPTIKTTTIEESSKTSNDEK